MPIELAQTAGMPSASPSSENQAERQTSVISTNPEQNRDRATVPSACVQCRSKHLKCDGLNPCTRCSSNSFQCVYVRSRRGFKGPRKNGKALPSPATPSTERACPLVYPGSQSIIRTSENVPSGLATPPDNRLQIATVSFDQPLGDMGQELVTLDKSTSSGLDLRERCLEAFYFHFYPAHPFLLPRGHYMNLRKEKPLPHLDAAMRYVGSFYVAQAPATALGLEAERAVYELDCVNDGFRVQAMLILAIGLDGYTFQEKALQILVDAQNAALDLGMNKREFPTLNGNGSDVMEESWRRTWWELFIVDGMIAGVHQRSSFRLNEIPADVALPCEEKEYESGVSSIHFFNDVSKY